MRSPAYLPPVTGAFADSELPSYASRTFEQLTNEATSMQQSSLAAALARSAILDHSSLPDALAALLATKLSSCAEERKGIRSTMAAAFATPAVQRAVLCDLAKILAADPAVETLLQPVLFFKGFHALATHRVAHLLWKRGNKACAFLLQSLASERFAADIHPGAQIGNGVMLDHATGVVIGGTAVLGSDLYILHGTTLGATGKPTPEGEQRHPTLGDGVTLGAGSTVLGGNVVVGDGATVGAAALVSRSVPAGSVVVGNNQVRRPGATTAGSKKGASAGLSHLPRAEVVAAMLFLMAFGPSRL